MEKPPSPMRNRFLSRQVHPNLDGEQSSLPYPDVCLDPRKNDAKISSLSSRHARMPQPRRDIHPASLQHPTIEELSSRVENHHEKEDAIDQRLLYPSLPVDCHFSCPPRNNFGSAQPITPSPKSSSPLHDNCSGWKVPCPSLEKAYTSSTLDSEGKRTGYDGPNQPPSIELLKPTASSLGHRVRKVTAVQSQQALSPTKSMQDSDFLPNSSLPPREESASKNVMHCFDDLTERGDKRMTIMKLNTASSTVLPFGKLNSSNLLSSDDDDMDEKTQNSNSLLDEFEYDNIAILDVGGMSLSPSKPVLQRCASWSPGYAQYREFDESQRSCPEHLRSYNIDPVASQLLRECSVHEGDQGEVEQNLDPLSMTESHVIRRMSGEGAGRFCYSPLPRLNSANFLISSSMPDLSSSTIPPAMVNERQDDRSRDIYPISPLPLFRDVSGNLQDVQTEDCIKSLARPVPQKFSMPATFRSPSRASLPPRPY